MSEKSSDGRNAEFRETLTKEQYAITRAGLEAFETIDKPGTVVTLDSRWAADDAWKTDAMNPDGGDLRQPRDNTPRYQCEADRVAAEQARQGRIR